MPLPFIQGGNPKVYNLVLTLADTEYAFTLAEDTLSFLLQSRGTSDLKVAFDPGESGTNYFTLKGSAVYYEEHIHSPITVYLQSSVAGTVVEFLYWGGKN